MDKSPIQWAIEPLRKYATFSGRASRAEFWWYTLAFMVVYIVISFVFGGIMSATTASGDPGMGMAAMMGGGGIVILLFWLALLIPTIAVQVRRLHDTNRSGWWVGAYYIGYLILMFTMFGSLMAVSAGGGGAADSSFGLSFLFLMLWGIYGIVLLVFFILPGTKGANDYGPDPYGTDLGEVFR